MKKIFITGGGGMLASEIESFYAAKGHEITAPGHKELDVLDRLAMEKALSAIKPDYVFHTAALHVNACEDDPQLAAKLNTEASQDLAQICQNIGAALIYISSCGFFGDEKRFYSEADPVVLKTVYARSKYEGEVLARQACQNTYAIRPGWLFGGSIKHKKNFVYQRYLEARKKPVIQSAGDKFGSPTYTQDLIIKIDQILEAGRPGLYHVTNGGGCSRAEYVQKIVNSCQLSNRVEPVDSSHFPRKANVPDCEMLHNANLRSLGLDPMPFWEEAIERYSQTMLKEIGN
ncbi:SDR family oxidoreductase [Candidatus Margulisiibacteriota bacterium]